MTLPRISGHFLSFAALSGTSLDSKSYKNSSYRWRSYLATAALAFWSSSLSWGLPTSGGTFKRLGAEPGPRRLVARQLFGSLLDRCEASAIESLPALAQGHSATASHPLRPPSGGDVIGGDRIALLISGHDLQ